MNNDRQPYRKSVICSLSANVQRALAQLDVHFDEQLSGLDLGALKLPPDDLTELRQAIEGLPPMDAGPVDLSGLTGVTDEEIDLDDLEMPEGDEI